MEKGRRSPALFYPLVSRARQFRRASTSSHSCCALSAAKPDQLAFLLFFFDFDFFAMMSSIGV
jgi:hypothetical protein